MRAVEFRTCGSSSPGAASTTSAGRDATGTGEQQPPEHVRSQVKVEYDVTPRQLTIVECRPPWRADPGPEWTRLPIARLRYTKATRQWTLYWRDRHLRFHLYDRITPSPRIHDLLHEIGRDPTAIFWE
jgi:Protein of unknown function (DUF3024)